MMLGSIEECRRLACQSLPRFVFDYIDGGADREDCLSRNISDLRKIHLLPTCLRDTRALDTTIEVFGRRWAAPLGIAPTGLNGLIRPHGDVMLARAAARAGLPFVLSTASNARLEAIHSTAPTGINWLQVYVMSDRSISEQMVRRALERDFGALVLTVDVPTNGNRRRDIRNGFRFPFRPGIRTLLNMARHPGWLVRMARHGAPGFVNLTEVEDSTTAATLGAALLAREMDRGLVWESLSWLRRIWSGPLVLKGILHPDDARKAVHHGVDAILVSNHGGRQLDAAPSTVAALAPIVDAVGARVPVFVDSGFRNGGDIAKALALGARAVFIGRPAVYGLAYGAEEGVSEVLRLLMTELVRTMTLLGVPAVHQIDRTYLASQRTL